MAKRNNTSKLKNEINKEILEHELKKKPTYLKMSTKEERFRIDFNENLKLNEKQQNLVEIINKNKITIVTGPWGTSKTFTACYAALEQLKKHNYSKIVLITPIVEVGDSVGFLPGLEGKFAPYIERFTSNLCEMIDDKELGKLMADKVIEFKPSQFLRGGNIRNSVVVVDEVQGFDYKELITIITRMNNSKIILCGDSKQNDTHKSMVAIEFLEELLHDIPECANFKFVKSDIMRDPLLIQITDRYEDMEASGRLDKFKTKNKN
jgi:phosphate starvation-inducible protein PhoH